MNERSKATTSISSTSTGEKGRPVGTKVTPKAAQGGITIAIEGDEVVIRLPKKDLSRKLLADLI